MKKSHRKRHKGAWLLGAAAIMSTAPASAFQEESTSKLPAQALRLAPNIEVGIRVLRPQTVPATKLTLPILRFASGKAATAAFEADSKSGAVRLISGAALGGNKSLTTRSASAYSDVALDFIAQNGELVGVSAQDLFLDADATYTSKEEAFLKFRVRRDGLAVQDATLDFRFKLGNLVQVQNRTYGEAVADGRPALSGLDASVHSYLPDATVTFQRDLYRVIPYKDSYQLVRVAEFAAATESDTYLVQVEAATGQIFEVRPTTFKMHGSATGHVHERWYGEPTVTAGYDALRLVFDGGGITTSGLGGLFRDVPDAVQPKLDGFSGTYVKVLPTTGAKVTRAGALDGDSWNVVFERSGTGAAAEDKDMAQSMTFYHITKKVQDAKRYLQASNPNAVPWLDQQLTANVNLSQSCNAYWNGSTINFYSAGGGCANTALIADVVYHEWGHGLDAKTGGIEDGAFSEGYGDIQSLIVSHSNILGIGFKIADAGPVRDLEPDKIYPRDSGEVHAEGLIIAGTFWDLWKDLRDIHGETAAGELLKNYAYKVILTASHYTDVYNALLVIDDDNGDLSDKTPNYCAINKNFAAHGLATVDEACNLAAIDEFQILDSDGDGHLEPGERAELWLTARNASSTAVIGLQGTLTVNNQAVSVAQNTLSWTQIPAHAAARSDNAAVVQVDTNVACGTRFTATVALASGPRSARASKELMIGRLAAEPATYVASDLPAPIRDNQTTTAPLQVDGEVWANGTTVNTARLKFDLTHTYVGDLTASLVAPDGTSKQVWRGSGSGDDMHFDQDISALVSGLAGLGTWKLQIVDSASQDVGTLDAAQLTLSPAKYICD